MDSWLPDELSTVFVLLGRVCTLCNGMNHADNSTAVLVCPACALPLLSSPIKTGGRHLPPTARQLQGRLDTDGDKSVWCVKVNKQGKHIPPGCTPRPDTTGGNPPTTDTTGGNPPTTDTTGGNPPITDTTGGNPPITDTTGGNPISQPTLAQFRLFHLGSSYPPILTQPLALSHSSSHTTTRSFSSLLTDPQF
jgi:hypothetical protein